MWNGTVAQAHGDEVVYAAYLNALIEGRPRKNDPYTALDAVPDASPLPESYFSIQFVPAYALAIPARLFGLSTAQTFLLLTALSATLTTLAVFWVLSLITADARAAAYGAVIILCLGSVQLAANFFLSNEASNNHLSFLRRYQPSATFPLFFIFFGLVWRMLADKRRRNSVLSSVLAGLTLALLIYSYFYLWTTAAAWLFCLFLIWAGRFGLRKSNLFLSFGIVTATAAAALIPYFWLLTQRTTSTDEGLLLTHSHAPDLFRLPEIIGVVVLILIVLAARRGHVHTDAPAVLFTAAFAATPFVVFNQQIITGRSLQPFHYEMFVANYVAMMAAVLCVLMILNKAAWLPRPLARLCLPVAALLALGSASVETMLASKRHWPSNEFRDEARPALQRLTELANAAAPDSIERRSVVLATDMTIADTLPTVAPQPVFWSPHMFNFPGVTIGEDKRRLATYMYYVGVDFSALNEKDFPRLDGKTKYYITSLISRARHNPHLTVAWKSISDDEIRHALDFYRNFKESIDQHQVTSPTISFVLTAEGEEINFSNLERWYERDSGERFGKFILYRVKLKETPK